MLRSVFCFTLAGLATLGSTAPLDFTRAAIEARDSLCRPASKQNSGEYSLPCSTYSSALTCPNGLQKKAGGTVLLVHGTGSTGAETWANGPYMELLPSAGPGYDVCYVNLPERALGDAQTSAEYVSYLTVALSSESATGKVSLISHSQGGLNVQWSLDFWPANRQLVKAFFAIAPDFHGTGEGPLACAALDLTEGGCNPSVLQQTVGSHFLDAINSQGGVALVGTTVAYTKEDDIIQPEILPVTSRLSGASVFAVQDLCGPLYIADHFTMTVSSAAYYLGLDALENGGTASSSHFNQASCAWTLDDVLLNNFNRLPAILSQAFHDALAVITYPKVKSEPLLRQYVCERGNAASYCASTNYPTDINGIQPS
ncbi:hypothetical protein JCM1841_002324 [Sporobolomyces salmonicolor]